MTQNNNSLDTAVTNASATICTKKWNRLPDYYKILKIKEYMEEKYNSEPKRKEIEAMLIKRINDGELNTCKIVTYDTDECKIKKIMLSKKEIY